MFLHIIVIMLVLTRHTSVIIMIRNSIIITLYSGLKYNHLRCNFTLVFLCKKK